MVRWQVPSTDTLEPPSRKKLNGGSGETLLGVQAHLHSAGKRVRIDRSRLDDRPIVMPSDTGPAAHAYRMLRAQVLQRAQERKLRTIGVLSAADREGKTVTAVNLALSLAAAPNQAVLLADLDLHRPGVASILKLQVEGGLDSWLAGHGTLEDITYAVEDFERLSILPTLHEVPSSSEVLATGRSQAMLAELRSEHREGLVLLDLPPLLLTDDFMNIAPHLDGAVLVAREGRTQREDLVRMSEMLGSVNLIGTVLNHSIQFESRAY
jgi:protein-tyrosine kinase